MKFRDKFPLGLTMSLALLFGFLHVIWPESPVSLKRLHVFLFNLCSGGSLILYYSLGARAVPRRVYAFFLLSLLYALAAAASWYLPALILSVPMLLIVESVRISRFSLFPADFFRPRAPVHEKFQQASLLCLSLGILIASLVIINNEYSHWITYRKLTMDVFFLGYSFPISLITMSIMFYFLRDGRGLGKALLQEAAFWIVNLGVIFFFVFIILESFVPEIAAAMLLTVTVLAIFFLFLKSAPQVQQKTFLVSGMVFLLFTAITGVLYIARYFVSDLEAFAGFFLLTHAMVSLYGWNLSGLFIIIRWNDFPIKLNSALSISLHWTIVLLLAPLARYYPVLAFLAVPAYAGLLVVVFMSRGKRLAQPAAGPRELPDGCVAVTGATGLIGKRIVRLLEEQQIPVVALVRDPVRARRVLPGMVVCRFWDFEQPERRDWMEVMEKASGVIHLAGTPLFARRWTESFKRRMEDSRVLGTRQLVDAIRQTGHKPEVFVSASALGIYGTDPGRVVDEHSQAADDLLARICLRWEAEARKLEPQVRTVQVRIGIVQSRESGALKELLLPFRLGAGGVFGDPHPFINWIHIQDIAGIFQKALQDPSLRGPYNAAAPNPVSNRDYARILSRVLHRPAFLRYPVWLLRILIGQAARYASGGPRVQVDRIVSAGYRFRFDELAPALEDILGKVSPDSSTRAKGLKP